MASSFRSLLEGLANSGQNVELQKQIGQLVRSGAIDKRQATNLFGELVPIATKNQKPPEPLSNSELADLRTRFANLDGTVSATLVSRAINTGQISSEEANEYSRRVQANRKPRGPSRDPSTANKSFADLANKSIDAEFKLRPDSSFSQEELDRFNKRQADARFNFSTLYGKDALQPITTYTRVEDIPRYTEEEIRQMNIERLKANPKSKFNRDKAKLEAGIPLDPIEAARARFGQQSKPSSKSGSSAPSSKSGSNLNREGFTKLLENLQESKAELASRLGKTNTPAPKVTAPAPSPAAAPAPRVTGPAFKVVNTPVTNPDAPTNNVTKPTGAAAGPKPKNKKQAKISSDFDQIDNLDLTNEQKNDLKFSRAQADNNTFNRGDFKFLLDKLEGSKIRQNRDAQSQERKNIYSRGLSSMFANF